MTNKEIFIKALYKAEANGYKCDFDYKNDNDFNWLGEGSFEIFNNHQFTRYHINEIIFDHKFAKAFWVLEEDTVSPVVRKYFDDRRMTWESHLLFMILQEKPLTYLEKYI